jgi:hypothetical protein
MRADGRRPGVQQTRQARGRQVRADRPEAPAPSATTPAESAAPKEHPAKRAKPAVDSEAVTAPAAAKKRVKTADPPAGSASAPAPEPPSKRQRPAATKPAAEEAAAVAAEKEKEEEALATDGLGVDTGAADAASPGDQRAAEAGGGARPREPGPEDDDDEPDEAAPAWMRNARVISDATGAGEPLESIQLHPAVRAQTSPVTALSSACPAGADDAQGHGHHGLLPRAGGRNPRHHEGCVRRALRNRLLAPRTSAHSRRSAPGVRPARVGAHRQRQDAHLRGADSAGVATRSCCIARELALTERWVPRQSLSSRVVVRLRALVLLPSRDLALQVLSVFQPFCKAMGLKVAPPAYALGCWVPAAACASRRSALPSVSTASPRSSGNSLARRHTTWLARRNSTRVPPAATAGAPRVREPALTLQLTGRAAAGWTFSSRRPAV